MTELEELKRQRDAHRSAVNVLEDIMGDLDKQIAALDDPKPGTRGKFWNDGDVSYFVGEFTKMVDKRYSARVSPNEWRYYQHFEPFTEPEVVCEGWWDGTAATSEKMWPGALHVTVISRTETK